VCEDLRNNGLGRAEEHFLPFVFGDCDASRTEILSWVAKEASDAGGFCSVKIMANYASLLDRRLSTSEQRLTSRPFLYTLASMYENPTWVFITRRSNIRQAISRVMSEKRGINHVLSSENATFRPGNAVVLDPHSSLPRVTISVEEIAKNCLDIMCENEVWERFFAENLIEPIRIYYEEFSGSVGYIKTIGANHGRAKMIPCAARTLVRLSDLSNDIAFTEFVKETFDSEVLDDTL
jgi:LPS sulfotransferase NodH